MSDDKFKTLIEKEVQFVPGESPSDEKLTGMMTQTQDAFIELEDLVGDTHGFGGKSFSWINNFARDIGDRSKINSQLVSNYTTQDYFQSLRLGETEHELDLMPIETAEGIIKQSLATCLSLSQRKDSIRELSQPGDWFLPFGKIENGRQKMSRKLYTYSPASSGDRIVFLFATNGAASGNEKCGLNNAPSFAQISDGGPFCQVRLVSSSLNRYQITLPPMQKTFGPDGSIINFSASNTIGSLGMGEQQELPHYLFATDGLNLSEPDPFTGKGREIPRNTISLYDWEEKEPIDQIISMQVSLLDDMRYSFYVQLPIERKLDENGKYVVIFSSTSIADQLDFLTKQLVFHNHGDSDEMLRKVKHSDLLGLRTVHNSAERSEYYGVSNIPNNDHSQYFHRDGHTVTDVGGGENIIRGDVLIGSTETSDPAIVLEESIAEKKNIIADSHKLLFGSEIGPEIYYKLVFNHSISRELTNLVKNFSDNSLYLLGPEGRNGKKNIVLDSIFRSIQNNVFGSTRENNHFIWGSTYCDGSLVFIPRTSENIRNVEGEVFYDQTEKGLILNLGNNGRINIGRIGYSATVGDGVKSFGTFSGNTALSIQQAIDFSVLNGGGTIKIKAGTYNLDTARIDIPSNIILEGEGNSTLLVGSDVIFSVLPGAVGTALSKMAISGSPATCGLSVSGENCKIEFLTISSCQIGIRVQQEARSFIIGDGMVYSSCGKDIQCLSTHGSNKQTSLKPIKYSSDFKITNWGDKLSYSKKWTPSSISISVRLNEDLDGVIGCGAFEIAGIGEIEFDDFIPVSTLIGIGGGIAIKRLGTFGNVTVGFRGYDKNLNYIGENAAFLLLNRDLTDTYTFVEGICSQVGATYNRFKEGIRFVRPYIKVSSNQNKIVFDYFELSPLTYAKIAHFK